MRMTYRLIIRPEGDNVRLIPLGDGHYAYVDAADYEWLSRHNWHLNNGYASRRQDRRRIYMHSEIMQPPEGMVVDHIDGNKTNDCRFNLRVCTREENRRNLGKHAGARSRFKGVFYDKRSDKWYAECRLAGKKHFLGYFDIETEAARAYDHAAVECSGIFARVNFPEERPPERRAEVHAQWQAALKKEGKKPTAAMPEPAKAARATGHKPRPRRGEGKKARTAKPRATSKPALAKAGGKSARKRAKGKKATDRDRKPHAQTQGRRGRKDPTKARKSEGKKVRTVPRPAGGTKESRQRKTQPARRKAKKKAADRTL